MNVAILTSLKTETSRDDFAQAELGIRTELDIAGKNCDSMVK